MSKRDEIKKNAAKVEAKYGKTLGASKGKAPVTAKPKVKVRPMGGLKPHGIKATASWKF